MRHDNSDVLSLTQRGAELLIKKINDERAAAGRAPVDIAAEDITRQLADAARGVSGEADELLRVARMEATLRRAAEQFRAYEAHHRAKGSEADEKADRNRQMAEMCEAALRG